tara:strand:- start:197 stop:325 length:129 start_codon:yes stop_codon:yes gene_type:complete
MGITMDGIYREVVLLAGVYQYAEKYLRTTVMVKMVFIVIIFA